MTGRPARALRPEVVSAVVSDVDGTLEPALDSLAACGVAPEALQIIVVRDPATTIPTGRRVDVVLDSRSAAGARRNQGAQVAEGQFLLLLDGGTALPAGAVADLRETLHRHTRAAAAAPAPRAEGASAELLTAPLQALLVRTAVWRHVGGLAGLAQLDGLDLGWRLLRAGYTVVTRADVVLPMSAPAAAVRADSWRVLYRNLGDQVLDAWLAGLSDQDRVALAVLGTERQQVQSLGPLDDLAVAELAGRSELALPTDPVVLDALAAARRRRRILVVTGDTLGDRMAGPAIRAWEMAHALAAEHDVVLGALGGCSLTSSDVIVGPVGEPELRELEAWCEVLIFQGFLLRDLPWLTQSAKVLVADMYDPIHLEVLEQDRHRPVPERQASAAAAVDVVNTQLRRADFFLCASSKQRDLWIGHLASLGRVNPRTYDDDEDLERLIAVAPFGVPSAPPVHHARVIKGVTPGISPDDRVLLWGGGIYNWFDPLTLLGAVDVVRRRRPDVRLYFLGTKHPNPMVPQMRMATAARELSDRLGLTGTHVFFNEGWVPYEQRSSYLLEADIGVSCHYRHVETAFSFRTRILDYLWSGLPIVCTAGDTFGDLVERRGLGLSVAAEDVKGLADALLRVLDDEDFAKSCAVNVRHVAREYEWRRALEPLLVFCRAPRPAPDRVTDVRHDPAADLARPPRTLGSELALARDYFRRGGVREVLRRAAGRLRGRGALPRSGGTHVRV